MIIYLYAFLNSSKNFKKVFMKLGLIITYKPVKFVLSVNGVFIILSLPRLLENYAFFTTFKLRKVIEFLFWPESSDFWSTNIIKL